MMIQLLWLSTILVLGIINDSDATVSSCPTCMHVNISVDDYNTRTALQSMWAHTFKLDPNCLKGGDSVNSNCNPTQYTVSKCETSIMRLRAVGLSGKDRSAVIDTNIVSRGCSERPPAEPDRCIDIEDDPQYKSALDSIFNRQFISFTLSGTMCYTSQGGAFDPSRLPTGDANRLFSAANVYTVVLVAVLLTIVLQG